MPLISAPAEIDFECLQGSPFQTVLEFFQDDAGTLPIDFTGYRIDMQIREGVADSGAAIVKSISTVGSSDADARIFYIGQNSDGTPNIDAAADPTNGMIYFYLSSEDTGEIKSSKAPKPRAYPAVANFFYDIEATPPGGEPRRIAFGKFDVTLEVTRV